MIKNIMFDLGGVIMTIDQSQAVKRFKELGLENANQLLDPYTQTGIFGDLEEGKISAEQFQHELGKLIGRELSFKECQYGWRGYTKEVAPYAIRTLDLLKEKGYRLILISNTNPFMMDWATSKEFSGDGRSLDDFFDAAYKSYEVKMMKPDERFFQIIIDNEKIKPEETLFVDDGPRNIEMAKNMGFNTFCPINGKDWSKEIMECL